MKRDIALYIKDILRNMEKAEKFIKDITYDDFASDEKTNYAVIRCIEIIGEATKNVPDDIRVKYSDIPWKKMAGMRDKISHFYFGANMKKVWLAVNRDIPDIKPHIKKILRDIKKQEHAKKQALKKRSLKNK